MDELREMVAWLGLLPGLAGAVVSAIHLSKSRWVGLLLVGFILQTILSTFYRVATSLLGGGIPMSSVRVGVALLLSSMLALVANAVIVIGLAGLLHEFRRRGGQDRLVIPGMTD